MSEGDKQSYNEQMGWIKKDRTFQRKGEFISNRSKDSPDEDFAENFSFFVLSKEILKSKVPKAYSWFIKKYTDSFKVKKGCQNEK